MKSAHSIKIKKAYYDNVNSMGSLPYVTIYRAVANIHMPKNTQETNKYINPLAYLILRVLITYY